MPFNVYMSIKQFPIQLKDNTNVIFIICVISTLHILKCLMFRMILTNLHYFTSSVKDIFLRITVANSTALIYISVVVGWIYFVAWSVSFYPQVWINYKRQSVVGLNFDFLALNIVGFAMYGIFNMGLFWNEYIQNEYFERYPRGLNPVLVNDVVFAIHAMFATAITIFQCYIYEVNLSKRIIIFHFVNIYYDYSAQNNECQTLLVPSLAYSEYLLLFLLFWAEPMSFTGWTFCITAVISSCPSH